MSVIRTGTLGLGGLSFQESLSGRSSWAQPVSRPRTSRPQAPRDTLNIRLWSIRGMISLSWIFCVRPSLSVFRRLHTNPKRKRGSRLRPRSRFGLGTANEILSHSRCSLREKDAWFAERTTTLSVGRERHTIDRPCCPTDSNPHPTDSGPALVPFAGTAPPAAARRSLRA